MNSNSLLVANCYYHFVLFVQLCHGIERQLCRVILVGIDPFVHPFRENMLSRVLIASVSACLTSLGHLCFLPTGLCTRTIQLVRRHCYFVGHSDLICQQAITIAIDAKAISSQMLGQLGRLHEPKRYTDVCPQDTKKVWS
jgi:hypothetical protein